MAWVWVSIVSQSAMSCLRSSESTQNKGEELPGRIPSHVAQPAARVAEAANVWAGWAMGDGLGREGRIAERMNGIW